LTLPSYKSVALADLITLSTETVTATPKPMTAIEIKTLYRSALESFGLVKKGFGDEAGGKARVVLGASVKSVSACKAEVADE
jgi:hypothetical protein